MRHRLPYQILPKSANSVGWRVYRALLLLVAGTLSGETGLQLGPRRDVTISSPGNGASEIKVSGATPHFWSQLVTVPVEDRVLAFDYFSQSGVDSFAVRFRDADGKMHFAGSQPMPLAETWQPFAIELSALPKGEVRFHFSLKARRNAGFQIRNFRLRKPNESELLAREQREQIKAGRQADAEAILNHLDTSHPGQIEEVIVGPDTVRIAGRSSGPARLVELPAHALSHHPRSTLTSAEEVGRGVFAFELPRYVGTRHRDRAISRWRLETKAGEIVSFAKWPTRTSVAPAQASLPKAVARSQKGIGGVPIIARDDHPIFELGVHHATVNFVIDALMSRVNGRGRREWEFEGRTYYLNEGFLRGKDATIRRLCRNDIVVTCILLVGNRPAGELRHPEAEPRGVFAMPDLATDAGAHHYRAVIHFLAERYSQPGLRIANWVMHNEVDQAGTWTNMGDQPLARYLETYHRSARIVYHTARQFDPHARVFISLTHHWAKPSSGHGTYTVRDLVKLWSEFARAEGDFEWGVAYHPYPQDLRNPDFANDDVTFDNDTPYITPKNIEILPRLLGANRAILLSEQGFNTPTLEPRDQQRQADALTRMFNKLQDLPSIEAFHLHRYQDMPDREGGLRFGLIDEHGNRKLAWDTYVGLGDESVAKVRAGATDEGR